MPDRKNLVPHLMLVAVAFIFATNILVGKTLMSIPPLFIGAARFSVAAIIFLPMLLSKKITLPKKGIWLTLIGMGITGVLIFNPLLYFGLHFTTSINATLINSFNPMTIAFFSHFWLKERLSFLSFLGLLISFIGIAWIVSHGDLITLIKLQLNPGDLLVFLSAFVWAAYTVLIRKAAPIMKSTHSTILATYIGVILLIPATLAENIWMPLPPITWEIVLSLVYLGIFPSVIAFIFWNVAVGKIGPTKAGVYYNLIPVFNIILASQFLNEKLMGYHLIGSLFIFTGILTPYAKKLTQLHKSKRLKV